MLNISLMTAVLLVALLVLVGLFITISIQYVYKNSIKSLLWFIAFYVLLFVMNLLIVTRTITTSPELMFIGYMLHLTAIIHLILGMFHLHHESPQIKPILYSLPVAIITLLFFTIFRDLSWARTSIVSFEISFITLYAVSHTKPKSLTNQMNFSALRIVMTLIALFHIVRALYTVVNRDAVLPETTDSILVVILILIGLTYFAVSIGILMQINTNLYTEQMKSESAKASLLENIKGFAYQCTTDEAMRLLYISKGFERITGYDADLLSGSMYSEYKSIILEKHQKKEREDIRYAILNNEVYESEYQIQTKQGELRWLFERGHVVKVSVDKEYYEGLVIDITERKLLEQNLEFLSYRDVLTGVGNRRAMSDRLTMLDQPEYYPLAIIMADLNGLKFANDSFGHDFGDIMIKQSATILQRGVDQVDDVFRVGGDEFIILLNNTTIKEVEQTIKSLTSYVDDVFGLETGLSISFGYAIKEDSSIKIHEVLKEAENIMYQAKLTSRPNSRKKAFEAVLHSLYEKDPLGKAHANQVSQFSKLLAEKLDLPLETINKVETAGLLHDVGKVVIDTSILAKPGAFDDEEFEIMKEHPAYGYRILSSVPDLGDIPDIVLEHHERADGLGYPNGLTLNQIRLEARIITIADAFSAMTLKDYYKPTKTLHDSALELRAHSGTQFDPDLVNVFVEKVIPELKIIDIERKTSQG